MIRPTAVCVTSMHSSRRRWVGVLHRGGFDGFTEPYTACQVETVGNH